ncbi:sigma-70 family RNA polymerase sigma factor [Trinickia mobilis]|uniref:sigma-70 family RNA polymerase sigma factor n=1 Tax=Trinickia mobilis TaxID=2816356 RepID=UPI001A8D6FDC|nr:sigma-70 family RNA polymerase sigma factor [Trinickia mobilis]
MPRPLTRRNAEGEIYKRLSTVDDDIAQWETVDAKIVASTAENLDYRAGGYIRHEVLLHLLRIAGKDRRSDDFYALFQVFMARVRHLIRPWLARRPGNPDELVMETCSAIAKLLAEDAADPASDEVDYFEVRFAKALYFFVLDRLEENERWYSMHQSSEDLVDNSEFIDVTSLDDSRGLTGPEKAALGAQIIRAFHALSDEERSILELRYLKGVKTSSKDADEETISKKLNLSERTIRNRLTSATKKLSKFKERQ